MSTHCNRYPGCGCPKEIGMKCGLPEKQMYFLVESNGDLSVTTNNMDQAKELVEQDFKANNEGGLYEFDDFQYTITPKMMTQEEYENLPETE